jgi:hypothetical protein
LSSSSDAPEFNLISDSYSRDRFYVAWRDAQTEESRWIRTRLPASYVARAEDLIHSRLYPAYHSLADIGRDAWVHLLHYRWTELDDPGWRAIRDAHSRRFEVDRLLLQQDLDSGTVDKWRKLLTTEREPSQRKMLIDQARGHADEMPYGYWRTELEHVIETFDH